MFMNNATFKTNVTKITIGNQENYKGNCFDYPVTPKLVPPLPIIPVCNPFGYISVPPVNTPMIVDKGVATGVIDSRVNKGVRNYKTGEKLEVGDSAIYSDAYTLAIKKEGLKAFDELDFSTFLTSADNAKTILKAMFEYCLTYLSNTCEDFRNSYNQHKHTSDGASPPIPLFEESFKGGESFENAHKALEEIDKDQLAIKDGTKKVVI